MVIKCTFSIAPQKIGDYTKEVSALSPLPEYITKRGPYVKEAGGATSKIITIYEFDRSRLSEAWEDIWKQLDVFRGVPGVTLSARLLAKGRRFPFRENFG